MQYAITIPTETTNLGEIRMAEHDVWKCLTAAMLANMTAGGRSSAEVCAWLLRQSVALQAYESAALALERDMVDFSEPGVREWWDGTIEAVHEAARVATDKSWCVDSAYENGDYHVLVEM